MLYLDRRKETSTTSGSGSYLLNGASQGYKSFPSGQVYYCAATNTAYEVGIGTVSGGYLSRDSILDSTQNNEKLNWGVGTKTIFLTVPGYWYDRIASGNFEQLTPSGNLVPARNNAFDVGITSSRWRNGWFTGDMIVGGAVYSNGIINTGTISNNGNVYSTASGIFGKEVIASGRGSSSSPAFSVGPTSEKMGMWSPSSYYLEFGLNGNTHMQFDSAFGTNFPAGPVRVYSNLFLGLAGQRQAKFNVANARLQMLHSDTDTGSKYLDVQMNGSAVRLPFGVEVGGNSDLNGAAGGGQVHLTQHGNVVAFSSGIFGKDVIASGNIIANGNIYPGPYNANVHARQSNGQYIITASDVRLYNTAGNGFIDLYAYAGNFTDAVKVGNGYFTTPSLTFANDTNTGFYLYSADMMMAVAGGKFVAQYDYGAGTNNCTDTATYLRAYNFQANGNITANSSGIFGKSVIVSGDVSVLGSNGISIIGSNTYRLAIGGTAFWITNTTTGQIPFGVHVDNSVHIYNGGLFANGNTLINGSITSSGNVSLAANSIISWAGDGYLNQDGTKIWATGGTHTYYGTKGAGSHLFRAGDATTGTLVATIDVNGAVFNNGITSNTNALVSRNIVVNSSGIFGKDIVVSGDANLSNGTIVTTGSTVSVTRTTTFTAGLYMGTGYGIIANGGLAIRSPAYTLYSEGSGIFGRNIVVSGAIIGPSGGTTDVRFGTGGFRLIKDADSSVVLSHNGNDIINFTSYCIGNSRFQAPELYVGNSQSNNDTKLVQDSTETVGLWNANGTARRSLSLNNLTASGNLIASGSLTLGGPDTVFTRDGAGSVLLLNNGFTNSIFTAGSLISNAGAVDLKYSAGSSLYAASLRSSWQKVNRDWLLQWVNTTGDIFGGAVNVGIGQQNGIVEINTGTLGAFASFKCDNVTASGNANIGTNVIANSSGIFGKDVVASGNLYVGGTTAKISQAGGYLALEHTVGNGVALYSPGGVNALVLGGNGVAITGQLTTSNSGTFNNLRSNVSYGSMRHVDSPNENRLSFYNNSNTEQFWIQASTNVGTSTIGSWTTTLDFYANKYVFGVGNPSNVGLTVKGSAGQAGNLLETNVNGGANVFSVSPSGNVFASGNLVVYGSQVNFSGLPTTDPHDYGRLYRFGSGIFMSLG